MQPCLLSHARTVTVRCIHCRAGFDTAREYGGCTMMPFATLFIRSHFKASPYVLRCGHVHEDNASSTSTASLQNQVHVSNANVKKCSFEVCCMANGFSLPSGKHHSFTSRHPPTPKPRLSLPTFLSSSLLGKIHCHCTRRQKSHYCFLARRFHLFYP